jgi:hypothetical protein
MSKDDKPTFSKEDLLDLKTIEERKNDPLISFEEMLALLKKSVL